MNKKLFVVIISILVGVLIGCNLTNVNSEPAPPVQLPANLKTHYLIDQEYLIDRRSLFATMGHLLVFNPGERDANLKVTVYFEDDEPQSFSLKAPAFTSSESNYLTWPLKIKENKVFALKVESSEPVICQSTIGWTNTGNDYSPDARTQSLKGIRETAKSYMAIAQLSQEWYVADGIVINSPNNLWIKESEWAIILNPHEQPVQLSLWLYYGNQTVQETITVPSRRVARIFMDNLVQHNRHYGVRIIGDRPVAAQWLRTVNWYDSPELMANWSVPAIPNLKPN